MKYRLTWYYGDDPEVWDVWEIDLQAPAPQVVEALQRAFDRFTETPDRYRAVVESI